MKTTLSSTVLSPLLISIVAVTTGSACYVESQSASPRTATHQRPGCASSSCTVADTSYYQPLYYQGYLVYYDDQGRPLYHVNGAISHVPVTYHYYHYYTWYYRQHRTHYNRWYRQRGHRYRSWRYRYWQRRARYWRARYQRWASRYRRGAGHRAKASKGRVSVITPDPRGAGRRTTAVRAKIRGRAYGFQACYTAALARRPTLTGVARIRFQIRADGSIGRLRIVGASLPPSLRACLAKRILRWRLGVVPQPIAYGPMIVRFSVNKPFATGLD